MDNNQDNLASIKQYIKVFNKFEKVWGYLNAFNSKDVVKYINTNNAGKNSRVIYAFDSRDIFIDNAILTTIVLWESNSNNDIFKKILPVSLRSEFEQLRKNMLDELEGLKEYRDKSLGHIDAPRKYNQLENTKHYFCFLNITYEFMIKINQYLNSSYSLNPKPIEHSDYSSFVSILINTCIKTSKEEDSIEQDEVIIDPSHDAIMTRINTFFTKI
jgi:hypothetical protein